MNFDKLKKIIETNLNKKMNFVFKNSGNKIPENFHVTEIGRLNKLFVDCGGQAREFFKCVVQIWVANDLDHRISTTKFNSILNLAGQNLFSNFQNLDVNIEFQQESLSYFSLVDFYVDDDSVTFYLDTIKTDCLAKSKCGLNEGCC